MTLEIVQVVQELSSAGGVETVASELARIFNRNGLPNVVLASAVSRELERTASIERVMPWLSRIPTRGPFRHIGRAIVVPLFTLAVTRALSRHPDAVVISHGDSLKGDVLVVHAVNAQSLAEKRNAGQWRWRLNPMHLWVSLRERWMIGGLRYRIFVAVSSRVTQELQQFYDVPASRIRVISNGIDLDRFTPDPLGGRAIRAEFGIPNDTKLLLFVGHEFHRKGLALAIAALEKLDDDVWLLVVGSDDPAPYRKLAHKARTRLIFAGHRSDLPAIYSAADAFVLPTAYETFSLVCMEAMACALPVFATSVGGIEEYLACGVNGFRIEPDADAIAATIADALADPDLMTRMRERARETARNYSWERVGAQYIELLRQIDALKHGGDEMLEERAPPLQPDTPSR
ncbi:glycosyltransferase family 4 protein [Bradyrhizobium liaoningense]|uniref:glycosyltransferase family 4 protein n=1 Tax=Bradyrhizobium liaoningense TaxID=43992 RepID=UPI001BAE12C2|nr:glycosyltransferase family 4 protein [Bradyrhizobium liaoningense]MBR0712619.1 glycosyltransferase family 4 protein [Bradyrhizobium liaoningense]